MNGECKFKFGEFVLIRGNYPSAWTAYLFSHETEDFFFLVGSIMLEKRVFQIIPYKGNEHLLGTTNNPEPKFEPRKGQLVAVRDSKSAKPVIREYSHSSDGHYWCVQPCNDKNKIDTQQPWLYCEPLKNHFDIGD